MNPATSLTVRPVASVEELVQLEHVIAAQYPPRPRVPLRADPKIAQAGTTGRADQRASFPLRTSVLPVYV